MNNLTRSRQLLILILAIALIARLGVALTRPNTIHQPNGSDSHWYWSNGYLLMSGATIGEVDGAVYDVSQLQPPPLYLIFIGIPQYVFDQSTAYLFVLLCQVVISTLTVYLAARLTRILIGSEKAANVCAALIGFSPAFIIESSQITTETLFIALLTLALFWFVSALSNRDKSAVFLVLSGLAFGAATLTRAVLLAFPLALAAYWIIVHWRRDQWRAVGRAVIFFAVFLSIVLTWTAYNLIRWNRFVIAGEGIAAFLYIGATGWDDPHALDQRLLDSGIQAEEDQSFSQEDYTTAATNAITADLPGYIGRRFGELAGAFLQPHGTVAFPGESVRDLAVNWLRDDRSLSGLIDVIRGDQFAIKALLYVFHYGTLILGAIGLWKVRRRWRIAFVLLGYIGYTLAVHLVFLALPRYLFPTLIAWAALAGGIVYTTQEKGSGDDDYSRDRIVVR